MQPKDPHQQLQIALDPQEVEILMSLGSLNQIV